VRCCLPLIAAALLFLFSGVPGLSDTTDLSWSFEDASGSPAWEAGQDVTDVRAASGCLQAATTGTSPALISPAGLQLTARSNQYAAIRMRLSAADGSPYFGAATARLYWTTATAPDWSDGHSMAFRVAGNGAWKDYRVLVGSQWPGWWRTIDRLKLVPCDRSGVLVQVQWFKIVRDETPPSYTIKTSWNYADGEAIADHTPTLYLRDLYEDVSDIKRVAFYWRPSGQTPEADWALSAEFPMGSDCYSYTYPAFPEGCYDLGVAVTDCADNTSSLDDPEHCIKGLRISDSAVCRIIVNAASPGLPVNKELFGSNALWQQWSSVYDPVACRFKDSTPESVTTLGMPSLRYPGGCFADTFYWKKSIGPVEDRALQYVNACVPVLESEGPVVFGLDDFLRQCQAWGATPILTLRFRWPGSAGAPGLDGPDPFAEALSDAADLVEYCNSPNDGSNPNGGEDWAAVRARNGHPAPYGVKHFEVGNEPWWADPYGSPVHSTGDGAATYASAFAQYASAMRAVDPTVVPLAGVSYQLRALAPGAEREWTYRVLEEVAPITSEAHAHVYLPGKNAKPLAAGQEGLYAMAMASSKQADDILRMQRAALRLNYPDTFTSTRMRLTEWGIVGEGDGDPPFYGATLATAVAAADMLRVFLENSDFLAGANWWHLVGPDPAALLQGTLTLPVSHVLRMFNHHFGTCLVSCHVEGSPVFDFQAAPDSAVPSFQDLKSLTAVASAGGGDLYLVVINRDLTRAVQTQLDVRGLTSAARPLLDCETWQLDASSVGTDCPSGSIHITGERSGFFPQTSLVFPPHSVTSMRLRAVSALNTCIGVAHGLPEGYPVSLPDVVAVGTGADGLLFVEDPDRSAGISVQGAPPPPGLGVSCAITGALAAGQGGRLYVKAESVSYGSGMDMVQPLIVGPGALCSSGPDLSSMLVSVMGRTGDATGDGFLLDIGKAVPGSTSGALHIRSAQVPAKGSMVVVTGVSFPETQGDSSEVPCVWTRDISDVRVLN